MPNRSKLTGSFLFNRPAPNSIRIMSLFRMKTKNFQLLNLQGTNKEFEALLLELAHLD